MIPQFGFAEILVIAMLALIVVGPKDLPLMARKAGQFFARIKAMGQEFKDAFDDMGAAEEMAELRKEIEDLKSMGKLSNLSDEAFAEDMRALDADIREGTDLASPKVPLKPEPAPEPKSEPETKSGAADKPDGGQA